MMGLVEARSTGAELWHQLKDDRLNRDCNVKIHPGLVLTFRTRSSKRTAAIRQKSCLETCGDMYRRSATSREI